MPNWCEDRLVVTGPRQALRDLVARLEGEDPDTQKRVVIDFERILPTPPELLAGRPGGPAATPVRTPDGDDGWFVWRNEHWGHQVERAVADADRKPEAQSPHLPLHDCVGSARAASRPARSRVPRAHLRARVRDRVRRRRTVALGARRTSDLTARCSLHPGSYRFPAQPSLRRASARVPATAEVVCAIEWEQSLG